MSFKKCYPLKELLIPRVLSDATVISCVTQDKRFEPTFLRCSRVNNDSFALGHHSPEFLFMELLSHKSLIVFMRVSL